MTTGQGLLGNNMFAYCLNNPVVLVDPSGNYCVMYHTGQSAFDAMNGIVDAGGGGGQVGPPGWNPGVNIPHWETDTAGKDFAALYYTKELPNGTKTTSLLSGSADACGFGTDGVTLLAFTASLLSFDGDVGYANFTVADIGNVDVNLAATTDVIAATAMVSAFSTSISFNIGNSTLTFGAYIGGVGWTAEYTSLTNWKVGAASAVGGYISLN